MLNTVARNSHSGKPALAEFRMNVAAGSVTGGVHSGDDDEKDWPRTCFQFVLSAVAFASYVIAIIAGDKAKNGTCVSKLETWLAVVGINGVTFFVAAPVTTLLYNVMSQNDVYGRTLIISVLAISLAVMGCVQLAGVIIVTIGTFETDVCPTNVTSTNVACCDGDVLQDAEIVTWTFLGSMIATATFELLYFCFRCWSN